MEKLNIRRAVVTGCTGAVGTALVKELTKRGAEALACAARVPSGRPALRDSKT